MTTQRKTNFNPDTLLNKLKKSFSVANEKKVHPPLMFNNASVTWISSHKHLGIILDIQLRFDNHIKVVSRKMRKTIVLLRKLQNLLPRTALITTYKTFIRPHLDPILTSDLFTKSWNPFSMMPAWP